MPHVEPGGALELAPAATDGATVRWRQFAGPAAAWGQDRDGNAVLAAPMLADGATIVMRQEWPYLPLPVPGYETGGAGVAYLYGATTQLDPTVLDPGGSRTLKVTPTDEWGGPAFTTPATAAKTYAFTAQVRAATATPGYTLQVTVVWKDSGGTTLTTVSGTAATPPNGTWATLTYQGTAPANTASAQVSIGHGTLSNPQPYWLGRIDGRDTSQTVQARDHTVSVAPAVRVRRTAGGDVAVARRRPALLLMDTVDTDLGVGASLGGAAWTVHAEGATTSLRQVWRDPSDPGRYRFVVGEPGTPGGTVQRAELTGIRRPFTRGTTWWWSAAFRITGPPPSSTWMNLMQVHQTPDGSDVEGPQPFGLYWQGSGRLVVVRRYDANATTTGSSYTEVETELVSSLATGTWHRIVLRIAMDKGGAGGASGSLGVWFNGVQRVNQTGIPFGYNDTAENYPKFGIYRGVGAGVNVAEFANVELGTTDLTSRITAPLPIEF